MWHHTHTYIHTPYNDPVFEYNNCQDCGFSIIICLLLKCLNHEAFNIVRPGCTIVRCTSSKSERSFLKTSKNTNNISCNHVPYPPSAFIDLQWPLPSASLQFDARNRARLATTDKQMHSLLHYLSGNMPIAHGPFSSSFITTDLQFVPTFNLKQSSLLLTGQVSAVQQVDCCSPVSVTALCPVVQD